MDHATRNDLNASADKFLAHLLKEVRAPRGWHAVNRDDHIAQSLEITRDRLEGLQTQLIDGQFGESVRFSAVRIAAKAGVDYDQLDQAAQHYVARVAAQAHLQQMEAFSKSITDPGTEFQTRPLYDTTAVLAGEPGQDQGRTLSDMVEAHLDFRRREDIGQSALDEARRALGWMTEALGPRSAPSSITTDHVRTVRDGLQKMDVRKRGTAGPFLQRQTENKAHWIAPQTSGKYWRSVQAFFAWMCDEGYLKTDPAAGIRVPKRANVEVATPDPFSNTEVAAVLRSPLFTGRLHRHAYLKAGTYRERCSYWWMTMLGLHTGMRAGEMSQLEVTDFDFASSPPVIHVRRENVDGVITKRTKNRASIRDIPISSVLIKLGLEGFVAQRAKSVAIPKRLFSDVPLGERSGKISSGMSHFFSRYWRGIDLWSTGRSTHVFRHTVVANLRDRGVPEEVISAIVGHSTRTQTGRYGKNGRPLRELADAIERLDYGFDVVALIEDYEQTV